MYSIIELQTNDGETAHVYQTAETRDQAMSKYHSVLAFAATSNVQVHACFVVDEQGRYVARECYQHIPETEESGEEE